MKFLLFLFIGTIILFFLWNILKRIFFKQFYNHFPTNSTQNKAENQTSKKAERKLNWDAETVDYEEIPSEKSTENTSKN